MLHNNVNQLRLPYPEEVSQYVGDIMIHIDHWRRTGNTYSTEVGKVKEIDMKMQLNTNKNAP